jgi:hypothetical protein
MYSSVPLAGDAKAKLAKPENQIGQAAQPLDRAVIGREERYVIDGLPCQSGVCLVIHAFNLAMPGS